MVEIEFSYIHDFDQDERIWAELTEEFGAQNGIKVHLRRMDWDGAWAELFSFTSLGKGPQVSHVGNTWVSSLARMNSLRPFKPAEIAEIGAAEDFIIPNWQTNIAFGDQRTWAIPWTAWIYVICYRKDLLKEAGVDPSTAFGTIKAARTTVERLTSSALEIPWLNTQLPVSFRDLLHIAASWIWAAGGDLMDKEGAKALFNSPRAIDGLKNWLEMYRAVPDAYKKLSQQETFDLFSEGRAAAVLCNIQGANNFINLQENPTVQKNLGVASVTETPWTGGGSFVIWNKMRGDPERERAALKPVKFLSSREIHLRYNHQTDSMPSRMDALHELYPQGNPAHEAIMLAAKKGRCYYNMPIWRRFETQLAEELGKAVTEAVENMSADPASILHAHLDALAERLNITLGM